MGIANIIKLLPKFKEKFFHNLGKVKVPYGIQMYGKNPEYPKTFEKISYNRNEAGTITDQLLMQHFSQKLVNNRNYDYGSLAVLGRGERIKWICIDFDTDKQIPMRPAIHKRLQEYGLEYVEEVSRDDRSHTWIMTDITPELAEKFMTQFMIETEMEKKEWEIYPLFQRHKAIVRIPGGYHMKAGKANGVLVDGEVDETPEGIMSAFINAKQYTEEYIQALITTVEVVKSERKKRKYSSHFIYLPRNMPAPMENLPSMVKDLASECQAYRKLIVDAISNDLIEERGINHHNAGLALAGLSRYHDHYRNDGKGEDWFNLLRTHYRSRGDEEHQWDAKPGSNPQLGVWKCSTMERYFSLCEGCPFKKRTGFDTPKQLLFGKKVQRMKVGDVTES